MIQAIDVVLTMVLRRNFPTRSLFRRFRLGSRISSKHVPKYPAQNMNIIEFNIYEKVNVKESNAYV